ncbi:hypothetical protein WJX72_009442 [[Myrmecia] bisecta]|uniref:cytochrome-b5 reductase n=1 Tax=[Myrmecia] bisecta TaxID=41462 RepID=A0AAW1PB31_9CHLO
MRTTSMPNPLEVFDLGQYEPYLLPAAFAVSIAMLLHMVLRVIYSQRKPFLRADIFQELPLVEKVSVSHNTRRFRFALPHKLQIMGLPTGQHITLKAVKADGTQIFKPYTPISDDDQPGFIDFVIKIYPDGRMSQHLDGMEVGDKLWFKGPRGRFQYQPNMKRAIGMLAGGTGITPMYQVAVAILKNGSDRTRISLIFANVSPDDILIQGELEALAAKHPDRFKVYYVLNKPPEGWKGGVGFVSKDHIQQHLPAPDKDVLVVRCGPPLMNKAMKEHLDVLGYTSDMQFEF